MLGVDQTIQGLPLHFKLFLVAETSPIVSDKLQKCYECFVTFRWDIQRMREQRVFEKLKNQESGTASQATEGPPENTFLPLLESCM